MKTIKYALVLAVLLSLIAVVAPNPARADSVVYSNFGTGDTHSSVAWAVGLFNLSVAGSFQGPLAATGC